MSARPRFQVMSILKIAVPMSTGTQPPAVNFTAFDARKNARPPCCR